MGPGGAVGLSLLAVDRAMDYCEIDADERQEFYERVKLVATTVLSEQYKAREAELERDRKRKR